MSYIIAATNLSAVADNAVYYAADLANELRMDLVILHAFSMPVMIGDVPAPASLINDTEADAERKMDTLKSVVAGKHPALGVTSIVMYGNVIESIEHYAQSHRRPHFTIMGNSNTSEDSAWFLSSLKSAVNELSFPIIAVPPGFSFSAPRSVCLALDLERKNNPATLENFAAYCAQTHLTLHVLYVLKDGGDSYDSPEVTAALQKVLAPAMPQFHYQHDDNIDESIDRFCLKNNIDWLAVIHGRYSLFEGLFHRSHTKALAETAQIPMLILHEHRT